MKLPFTFEKSRFWHSGAKTAPNQLADTDGCNNDAPVEGLSDLYMPQETGDSHILDIAEVLVDMGKLTSDQLANLWEQCRNTTAITAEGVELLLLKTKLISADDILAAKARLYDLEFQYIDPKEVEKQAFEKLDVEFIKDNSVCPIAIEQDTLVVATNDPANDFAIEQIRRQTDMDVRTVVCRAEDIDRVCDFFRTQADADIISNYCVDEIIGDMTDVEIVDEVKKDFEDLEKMAGQSPVIKFVNYLISRAIHEGASDIHIEPKDKYTLVRYRIDGVLFETLQSPLSMHPAVVSRIKIMSNLDISERRLPQDGKISVIVGGRGVDLRVSILPTNHGEKVVIRVLDSTSITRGLKDLGMEPAVTEAFARQIAMPHGILLVTGPTGSGKSTTLYSALNQMDGKTLNISTVEDPVEYELDFCNQIHVNETVGLTFASALRSLLRQDPDIIMIGEIRDQQTARIAVQAALTGHLVLSTLHTNDAPSSVTRLVNIGVDAYLIAASLNAVLAQRLVRRICPKCREVYKVPSALRKHIEKAGIKPGEVFHGGGCEDCRNSGYAGRVGIYELMIIDESFREMINKDCSAESMRKVFRQSGQASLFDDGMQKVRQGLTTIEEVLRVTEANES